MSETVVVVLVAAVIIIGVVVWIVQIAAASILAFTAFVMGLPTVLAILMFIIFPPTFVVFLIGYGLIKFGVAEKMFEEKAQPQEIIHPDGTRSPVNGQPTDDSSISLKRMAILFIVMTAIVVGMILLK